MKRLSSLGLGRVTTIPGRRLGWRALAVAAILAPAITSILTWIFLGFGEGLRGNGWQELHSALSPSVVVFGFTVAVFFGFLASLWMLALSFLLASLAGGSTKYYVLAGAVAGALHSLAGSVLTWNISDRLPDWLLFPVVLATGFGLHETRADSLTMILPAAVIAGAVAGKAYAVVTRRLHERAVRLRASYGGKG